MITVPYSPTALHLNTASPQALNLEPSTYNMILKVHVPKQYILWPESTYIGTTLRPKYILFLGTWTLRDKASVAFNTPHPKGWQSADPRTTHVKRTAEHFLGREQPVVGWLGGRRLKGAFRALRLLYLACGMSGGLYALYGGKRTNHPKPEQRPSHHSTTLKIVGSPRYCLQNPMNLAELCRAWETQ